MNKLDFQKTIIDLNLDLNLVQTSWALILIY